MNCPRKWGFLWRLHDWTKWSLVGNIVQARHCQRCGFTQSEFT